MRNACALLLLIVSSIATLVAEQYDLAVVAIFQNEAPYFREWIEFHKIQGVKHFYLYNHNSTDDFEEVLSAYVESGEVTLTDWLYTFEEGDHEGWIAIQSGAYTHCVDHFGGETTWLAAIDIDEFLFCPDGRSLPTFLRDYEDFGGIAVNWLKFGTSDVEDIPPGKLMIEMLTCHGHPDLREHHFIKSIVQPKYVNDCTNAHYFNYVKGMFAVDSNKKRMKKGMYSKDVLLDKIRINHYWARTVKWMREVKIPSRQNRRSHYTSEVQLKMLEPYNEYESDSIFLFVPQLRQALNMPLEQHLDLLADAQREIKEGLPQAS